MRYARASDLTLDYVHEMQELHECTIYYSDKIFQTKNC